MWEVGHVELDPPGLYIKFDFGPFNRIRTASHHFISVKLTLTNYDEMCRATFVYFILIACPANPTRDSSCHLSSESPFSLTLPECYQLCPMQIVHVLIKVISWLKINRGHQRSLIIEEVLHGLFVSVILLFLHLPCLFTCVVVGRDGGTIFTIFYIECDLVYCRRNT
jgi:hypothetical protein